jgi:hypothetical protein
VKQQSAGRHIDSLGHIILIPSNQYLPIFLNTEEKQQIANFILFGLTWGGIKHTSYHIQGEHTNHYTIDVVLVQIITSDIQYEHLMTIQKVYLKTNLIYP